MDLETILEVGFTLLLIYVMIGIGFMFILEQTPYADNPIWTMILLWPIYLWQGI